MTKLSNGIVVASLENNSPVTRIAAVFNAGPRDETPEQQGATHALRVYSSLATKNFSVFGLSRNLDQIGAQLSVTSSREQTTYLLEGARNKYQRGVEILDEIINRPEFRHWEISDAHARLEFDLNVYDEQPETRIADLIHRVAYKNALSRPLFAPRFNLHHLDEHTMKEFRSQNLTANRLSVVGVGIRHDDLVRIADQYRLPAGQLNRQKAKYIGGEIREENQSGLVHIALASEGASLSSKDLLASGIASQALGAGSRIKYSAGSNKLARAIASASAQPALATTFNANYSDSGLFGVNIIAQKSDAGAVLQAAFKELIKTSKNGLSADEVANAKNALKANLAASLESSVNLIGAIGLNPENPSAANVTELLKAVDAVSAADVNAFVKRVGSGKLSLAAIGDLNTVPRLDELSA